MLILGYVLAALIGLSLGLMGGGGSILTVPIFVYVLGYDPKLAIAMSLPVVGVTSLVGAISHWKAGNVDLRVAFAFGIVAMGGAFVGARVADLLSGAVQLTLLGAVMLAAAIAMFRNAQPSNAPAAADHADKGASYGLLLLVAVSVGLMTGVVGVGGGFLVVPALVIFGRTAMKRAVGTSLLVIALNCLSGFAGYSGRMDIPWGFLMGFGAIAIGGILAGTYIARFVAQRTLKKAFSVFLVCMGVFILAKNRAVFTSSAPTRLGR